MKHRAALGSAALLLVIGTATGCSGDDAAKADPPAKSSTPSPTSSPTPTTPREKAVAEAQRTLKHYFKVTDQVGQNPKAPLSRLQTVAITTVLITDAAGYRRWRRDGWHKTGSTKITKMRVDSISLDNSDPDKGLVPTVAIRVCTDASGIDVLDRSGKSVVLASRPDEITTKFIVANYSWKTDKRGGWRVASAQDEAVGSCTL